MMASQASPRSDHELRYLERLGAEYTARGFSFIAYPSPDELPDFFRGYRPDAIARGPKVNVAFELKQHIGPDPESDHPLSEIRRIFEDRPDWRFNVAYIGNDPRRFPTIATPTASAIQRRKGEVTALLVAGQRRAAFLLGWSLLEAALRHAIGAKAGNPQAAGALVQCLATRGLIGPETEARLRRLVELRNRLVHGDLEAEPGQEDVSVLLAAIDEAMQEAEAA
jgi:uncharacterized protein YutE (UPF0331/DUF86 family)